MKFQQLLWSIFLTLVTLTLVLCQDGTPGSTDNNGNVPNKTTGALNETKLEFIFAGRRPSSSGRRSTSFYFISNRVSTWNEAVFICHHIYKGQLASLDGGPSEYDYINALLMGSGIKRAWTGGSYDIGTGTWRWPKFQQQIYFQKWIPGQPWASGNGYHIVQIAGLFDNGWESVHEANYIHSICEA